MISALSWLSSTTSTVGRLTSGMCVYWRIDEVGGGKLQATSALQLFPSLRQPDWRPRQRDPKAIRVAERIGTAEDPTDAERNLSRHLEVHAEIEIDAEVVSAIAVVSALGAAVEGNSRVNVRRDRETIFQ